MSKKSMGFFLALTVILFAAYSFSVEQRNAGLEVLEVNNAEASRAAMRLSGNTSAPTLVSGVEEGEAFDEAILDSEAENPFISVLNGEENADGTKQTRAEAAKRAIDILIEAASRNDKTFLKSLQSLDPNCYACNAFYQEAKGMIAGSDIPANARFFLSDALVQSKNPTLQSAVAEQFNDALNNPSAGKSPNVFGDALGNGPLAPEVVDEITAGLNSENPYVRDAILSVLTQEGSLESAKKLYEFTVEKGNPNGFYLDHMGLGQMDPKPEAFEYLESLVMQNDQYSHLAVKALLNSGMEGLKRVVSLLTSSTDFQSNKGLMVYAVDRVDRDQATLKYLNSLTKSDSPAVRQLANGVIREAEIQEAQQHKEIEYNENFENGIIWPGQQPRG